MRIGSYYDERQGESEREKEKEKDSQQSCSRGSIRINSIYKHPMVTANPKQCQSNK
jgi:hypothetical protein